MAEGARLESVYTATYRGFESPPHRHILRRARTKVRAFFSHIAYTGGMRSPDRGSQIVDTVRFVHAGCGMNVLSAPQNLANSIHCDYLVGLISVAHQASYVCHQSQSPARPGFEPIIHLAVSM